MKSDSRIVTKADIESTAGAMISNLRAHNEWISSELTF
jgi:hypothetical protein